MTWSRHDLAHIARALVLTTALAGCYDAHGLLGRDAGPPARDADLGRPDTWRPPPPDAGPQRTGCEPQDAREVVCPGPTCDGPGTWHWNGDRCHYVDCGACEGTDCDRGWSSEDECIGAHATCEPSLCRETGGEWRFWSEECAHWECGSPPPVDCFVGRPVCDCGPLRRFDPERGCVDAACPAPEPISREMLCVSTGGAWASICCDTECGRFCPLPCAMMACDCGPLRVFDEVRGCREAERCFEPRRDEPCSSRTRCERGTTCCGEGEAATCTPPVCAPDGDLCGVTPGG